MKWQKSAVSAKAEDLSCNAMELFGKRTFGLT